MNTVTELRMKQEELVAKAREALDEADGDVPEERSEELHRRYDTIMSEYDRIEARVAREEKLAALEASATATDTTRRPRGEDRAVATGAEHRPALVTHEEAFRAYLRNGIEGCSASEKRVLREKREMGIGQPAPQTAGILVPGEFQNELVKAMVAWGPMLDPGITREIVTATGAALTWPVVIDANAAGILVENVADADADPAFTSLTMGAFKYTSGIIRVSEELAQDAAVDLEGLIRSLMAERMGRAVNTDLTTGLGGGVAPQGILVGCGAGPNQAVNDAVDFDDMIELVHSVDPAYRTAPNVRFMFNDTTLKLLRQVKDAVGGNYIWQPADARTGAPATILGHNYSINQAMPNVVGAAGLRPIVFGDFSKYVVRRVKDFSVKRLTERYSELYQLGFLGMGRYDGLVMDATAIRALVNI